MCFCLFSTVCLFICSIIQKLLLYIGDHKYSHNCFFHCIYGLPEPIKIRKSSLSHVLYHCDVIIDISFELTTYMLRDTEQWKTFFLGMKDNNLLYCLSISGLQHLKLTLFLEDKEDLANKEIGDQQKKHNRKIEIHRRVTALKRRSGCYSGETLLDTCCPTCCHFVLAEWKTMLLSYFSGSGTRVSVFNEVCMWSLFSHEILQVLIEVQQR